MFVLITRILPEMATPNHTSYSNNSVRVVGFAITSSNNDLKIYDPEFDYILYAGKINFVGYEQLSNLLEEGSCKRRKRKGYLILVTNGGLPDAAYRIARALGHHYPEDLRLFVPDVCKSAGTLIAMGANELIISNRGELGPLDIQIQKKEEIFEMSSGLDIVQSLQVLQDQVAIAFREYLLDIRLGSGLGTKFAAQLASEMAANLVGPIASQIDPLRLGEHQRALRVATAYGQRLNEKFKNTEQNHIDKLIAGYPSHSFVIDRKEAADLFFRVREPNTDESKLEANLREKTDFVDWANINPIVCCLNDNIQK